MTLPEKLANVSSSHCTVSASRWLVGSSSRSISGFCNNSLHKATRRASPPERVSAFWSSSGRTRASIATSTWRSSSQPSTASIWSCSRPIFSMAFSISSSDMGSAILALTSLNSSINFLISLKACSTFSRTVLSPSKTGSCGRKPMVEPFRGAACPSNSLSSPAMILRRVDFPEPFSPTMPIFVPW